MLDDLSSVWTILRLALLFAGVAALAVWAARQPNQEPTVLKRLTERRNKCAGD